MPSRRPWLRLYSAIRTDPRVKELTPLEFRTFIYLLALACDNERQGYIERSPGVPYSDKALAAALDLRPQDLKRILARLQLLGIGGLAALEDKTHYFGKWRANNPLDPLNAQRQAYHRADRASNLGSRDTHVTTPLLQRDPAVTVTAQSREDIREEEEKNPSPVTPPPEPAVLSSPSEQGGADGRKDPAQERIRRQRLRSGPTFLDPLDITTETCYPSAQHG